MGQVVTISGGGGGGDRRDASPIKMHKSVIFLLCLSNL